MPPPTNPPAPPSPTQLQQLAQALLDSQAPRVWLEAACAAPAPAAAQAAHHALGLGRELLQLLERRAAPLCKPLRLQLAAALPFRAFKAAVERLQAALLQHEEHAAAVAELARQRQEAAEAEAGGEGETAPPQEQLQLQLQMPPPPPPLPSLGPLVTGLAAFREAAGSPTSREHAAQLAAADVGVRRAQVQLGAAAQLVYGSPQLAALLLRLRPSLGPTAGAAPGAAAAGGAGPQYSEALELVMWGLSQLHLWSAAPPPCLDTPVLEALLRDCAAMCAAQQVGAAAGLAALGASPSPGAAIGWPPLMQSPRRHRRTC